MSALDEMLDYIDRKEAIAAAIFDSDRWDEERPNEEMCHVIAEIVLDFLEAKTNG